ncbi:MAG: DUF721 domain-containing protein [Puniceicoccaceae bacterium]
MKKPFPDEVERMIASLRNLPEDPANLKDPGSKPLDSLLEICIEKYHIGKHTPEEAVLENWERIVGKALARRCRPERIDKGTLVVQVANPTLRSEIRFMESRILTALGSIEECQHIHRIALKGGN